MKAPPDLKLGARCPKCGAPPAIRIPESERELSHQLPPAAVRMTYQCRTPWCREVYEIRALDYQRAG